MSPLTYFPALVKTRTSFFFSSSPPGNRNEIVLFRKKTETPKHVPETEKCFRKNRGALRQLSC